MGPVGCIAEQTTAKITVVMCCHQRVEDISGAPSNVTAPVLQGMLAFDRMSGSCARWQLHKRLPIIGRASTTARRAHHHHVHAP